jgi:hypothetical protein
VSRASSGVQSSEVITRNAVVAACVQQHQLQQALEVVEGAWQCRLETDAAWRQGGTNMWCMILHDLLFGLIGDTWITKKVLV